MTVFVDILAALGLLIATIGFIRFLGSGAGMPGLIAFAFGAMLICIAAVGAAKGAPICRIPREAYQINRTLTARQYRRLERYGRCVCGPQGYNDYSISPGINYEVFRDPRESRYRFHPSCER